MRKLATFTLALLAAMVLLQLTARGALPVLFEDPSLALAMALGTAF